MDKNVEDLNGLYLVNLENIGSFFSSLFPGGVGGTPIHYLYGYVPPDGVVQFTNSSRTECKKLAHF